MKSTLVSPFGVLTSLFQSIEASVVAANRLSKAYADGVGKSEFHNEFGADQPEKVAMNLAGLYATDSAALAIAAIAEGLDNDGNVKADAYLEAIARIGSGRLTDKEVFLVKISANTAWRAGQPFRGITTDPLARITRSVNMHFCELPVDEKDKDMVQVMEGARIILEAYRKAVEQ